MKLEDFCVFLASGSPRRVEMLENDGLSPYIIKPGCSEDIHSQPDPRQLVMSLALRKGLEAEKKLFSGATPFEIPGPQSPFIMISADTVVCKDGRVFGKPEDRLEAGDMLLSLRADVHQVCSGVFLNGALPGGKRFKRLFCDITDVFVKDFSDAWLSDYLDSGEPYDKAGAYAIQGLFGVNIDKIEGNYDNVVGLPYGRIKEILSGMQL